MAPNKKKREHPNVAWFKKHNDLPQPSGKPVSVLVPFGALTILALAAMPAIGFLWTVAGISLAAFACWKLKDYGGIA